MDIFDICGYSAGIFYVGSFIPQIYKSYQTKCLDDVSYLWQFIFIFALALSIIYSLHYNLKPIYITSSIELLMMLILIIMKYYYSKVTFTKINEDNDIIIP
jgi:MtN3 and saliva related transmembrane protein